MRLREIVAIASLAVAAVAHAQAPAMPLLTSSKA